MELTTYKQTQSIANLTKAMCNVQRTIEHAKKDAVNPYFGKNYSTLPSVLNAILPHSSREGIAIMQFPVEGDDCSISVLTIISHESGESIETVAKFPFNSKQTGEETDERGKKKSANVIQKLGSSISYARRYVLLSAFGISADDDTDGIDLRQERELEARKLNDKPIREVAVEVKEIKRANAAEQAIANAMASLKKLLSKAEMDRNYKEICDKACLALSSGSMPPAVFQAIVDGFDKYFVDMVDACESVATLQDVAKLYESSTAHSKFPKNEAFASIVKIKQMALEATSEVVNEAK